MKRVLSLVLALSMVMSMFTFSFAGTTLSDVEGTEYQSAVEALVELGVVNGYDDGTYLPENVVSRAEMAKLLVVAAGLAPAAELAEGTTRFADVAADHWATGYINVAAEYGYIMGDPDGNFRPDDTVSYAEAITMALRVLGYKTVVEAKGTWPTNYIAKAEELDLLEDITYGSYAAGATRGNVALLIWNMLRENMWDVKEESEGDGLTYSVSSTMLNKKFKDYKYLVAKYVSYRNDEGEILVTLAGADGYVYDTTTGAFPYDSTEFTYAKADFYTYVPASEVEVLINIKDDTLLSMVETDTYKYVEGSKVALEEKYDKQYNSTLKTGNNNIWGDTYVYAYGLVDGKVLTSATKLVVTSTYVYEIDDSSSKRLEINGGDNSSEKLKYEDFEKYIVIKDGEFASVEDLKAGDVWSEVRLNITTGDPAFYMISGAEDEGKFTKLVAKTFDSTAPATPAKEDYYVATLDGEEVVLTADAIYFEDVEDIGEKDPANVLTITSGVAAIDPDMKNEVVTYTTDFLGRVVAMVFDGKLNAGDAATGDDESKFYSIASKVERDGSTYTITVATEDGEEELTFAKGAGNGTWIADADIEGYFVLMTLNDDGEIESLVGDQTASTKYFYLRGDMLDSNTTYPLAKMLTSVNGTLTYNTNGTDSTTADDKFYTVEYADDGEYEDGTITGTNLSAKVNDDTVVVVLVRDDKDTTDVNDDEYSVEYTDISAIENMKNDDVVVITDKGESKFARAKYVVIFDEVSNREDDLVGIVKNVSINKLGKPVITIVEDRDDEIEDGVEYILSDDSYSIYEFSNLEEGVQFVVYSIEENKDGDWVLTIENALTNEELVNSESDHAYIRESAANETSYVSDDGREAQLVATGSLATYLTGLNLLGSNGEIDLDNKDTAEIFEDARIFVVNVTVDEDETEAPFTQPAELQYYVDNYTEVEYADVKLKEADRLSFIIGGTQSAPEVEGVVIIRGLDAKN